MYPSSLQKLIEDLRLLPGVGEKTAERFALHILELEPETVKRFSADLVQAKEKIRACRVCGNMTEKEVCDICADQERNHRLICVVQEPRDVYALEKTEYKGVYHVLNGVISPSKGILPEDINIQGLLDRIDGQTEEVILALNPTVDGETTALYLSKILRQKNVPVSRIAHGLPMGGSLDYADDLTLIKAMEGRTKE